MNVSENTLNNNVKHVLEQQPKNTCVMLDANGQEVPITKDMVVSMCYQLLQQCRTVKN